MLVTSENKTHVLEKLLSVLADGQWHSGQFLADQVALSRTAVWKQLAKLEDYGLHVETLKGKGYRLSSPVSLLDVDSISAQLNSTAQSLFKPPQVLFTVDSSNTYASQHLRSGDVCLAEHQSAGKGRRGRSWLTPLGSQVSMSLVFEFNSGISEIAGLSLAVGLAVVQTLEKLGYEGIGLKWPNDIVLMSGQAKAATLKKLGGILLEIRGDISGPCQVIIGLGLNVNVVSLQTKIEQPWIDLSAVANKQQMSLPIDRNQLCAQLLNELAELLTDYAQVGFSYYQQAWMQRDVFYGKKVKLLSESHEEYGIERGVDEQGQLIVETDSGVKVYNGGEVSLRLL